jgi:hypothetical protein
MNDKPACKAAFSEVDITPDYTVELIGFDRGDNRSTGVLHPLKMQVLLFQNDAYTFSIITIDSLGFTVGLSKELRLQVAAALGTDMEKIMLCFSHTHSAPAPFGLNGERYFREVCKKAVRCALQAQAALTPCRAGWALTDTGIGENRREGCTAVDRRLGALKVADAATGDPIAVLLRLTAHANVLMLGNNRISSDYFGTARERLRGFFSCPVMLVQGAAGNVKPIGTDKIFGGKESDLPLLADMLALSARDLRFEMRDVKDIQMVSEEINFYSGVPDADQAKRIAREGMDTCGIDGTAWLSECARLRSEGTFEQVQKAELQMLKINNGCIGGVADEIFCEISLNVRDRTNNPLVFLNGYTNGCTGYLPSGEEWKKGGYETLYSYMIFYPFHGHVMPYHADTAGRLADFAAEMWRRLDRD